MVIDPEKLLLKIRRDGKISKRDAQEVIHLLESFHEKSPGPKMSLDEVYSLLFLLGEAKQTSGRYVIEKFLEVTDPLTVSLVLDILCLRWGLIEEYLERIIQFSMGVPWDYEHDLQIQAIEMLSKFLKKQKKSQNKKREKEAIDLLYSTCTDESNPTELRQSAYNALLRVEKSTYEKATPDSTTFTPNNEFLQNIYQKLQTQK